MQKTYEQLLSELHEKEANNPLPAGKFYTFEDIGEKLSYNPSVPFTIHASGLQKDIRVMYVRVESVNANWLDPTVPYDSQAVLYYEDSDGVWKKVTEEILGSANGLVFENTEDPFITFVHGELVFGVVVMEFPKDPREKISVEGEAHFDYTKADVIVTTAFYRGKTVSELQHFATIRNMKDIRLGELADGSILVVTRPQGGEAGIGSIGLTKINSLGELTQETIDAAPLMKDLAAPNIKLGALEIRSIRQPDGNETAGIIGVTAYADSEKQWHYFATAFIILNPNTFLSVGIKHTAMKVIAWRKNWGEGRTKRLQTKDVIFPAGIAQKYNKTYLITGLSDAQVGEIEIPYPFEK
jgi:hypothetical protein